LPREAEIFKIGEPRFITTKKAHNPLIFLCFLRAAEYTARARAIKKRHGTGSPFFCWFSFGVKRSPRAYNFPSALVHFRTETFTRRRDSAARPGEADYISLCNKEVLDVN